MLVALCALLTVPCPLDQTLSTVGRETLLLFNVRNTQATHIVVLHLYILRK